MAGVNTDKLLPPGGNTAPLAAVGRRQSSGAPCLSTRRDSNLERVDICKVTSSPLSGFPHLIPHPEQAASRLQRLVRQKILYKSEPYTLNPKP